MIENSKKLIIFILFLLILSACSSDDSSGPKLVEISSDEENVDYEAVSYTHLTLPTNREV